MGNWVSQCSPLWGKSSSFGGELGSRLGGGKVGHFVGGPDSDSTYNDHSIRT